MTNIDLSMLSKIPYLDLSNLQGRFISSLTFYHEGHWRIWLPVADQLMEIQGSPAEAFYFAVAPELSSDIYLHFLDFIAQQASFPKLIKPILGLKDDLFNLSASLAKITHFHAVRDIVGAGVSRMVVTEVEYLFSICRSIFDLFQEIASVLWESILLHDTTVNKKALKDTFSNMVLYKGRLSTHEELVRRFGLPHSLAAYYVRNAEFFMELRNFRDNVVHGGSQVQSIFSGDTGFFIQGSFKPFSKMKIWKEDEKLPNDLVPLLPALGVVVHKTLAACDGFSETIQEIIQFPSPLVPGMKFFMRGFFNDAFSSILLDARNRINAP